MTSGPRIVDADRELGGGKAAEHHRMNGAEPRRRQHGDDRLGHHRHIDQDAVALDDAEIGENGGEDLDLVEQRAVVVDRRLVPVTGES